MEKSNVHFDANRPESFIEAITLVKRFLDATYTERKKMTRMMKQPTCPAEVEALDRVLCAINVVQRACPKLEWPVRARVLWFEDHLGKWTHMVDQANDATIRDAGHHIRDYLEVVSETLTIGCIGQAYGPFSDLWLALLCELIRKSKGACVFYENLNAKIVMVRHILNRTGCRRPNDPHREEEFAYYLYTKYDISRQTVADVLAIDSPKPSSINTDGFGEHLG